MSQYDLGLCSEQWLPLAVCGQSSVNADNSALSAVQRCLGTQGLSGSPRQLVTFVSVVGYISGRMARKLQQLKRGVKDERQELGSIA